MFAARKIYRAAFIAKVLKFERDWISIMKIYWWESKYRIVLILNELAWLWTINKISKSIINTLLIKNYTASFDIVIVVINKKINEMFLHSFFFLNCAIKFEYGMRDRLHKRTHACSTFWQRWTFCTYSYNSERCYYIF